MTRPSFYTRQNRFFHECYKDGHHGWPTEEPTPHVVRHIDRVAGQLSRKTALDIGCGEGRHSIVLAAKKFRVDAIDIEPLALVKARQFARRKLGPHHGIRFAVGNALDLKFPDGTFDLVIDYGCFHHILKRDWKRYFRNVTRVMTPDACMIVSMFSTEYKHDENEKPRSRPWLVHRGHYDRFFNPRSIRNTFGRDFEILKIDEERHGIKVFYHVLMRRIN